MTQTKRWITGEEILTRWAAMDFELVQAFDAGLCPYCQDTGQQITRIGPKQSKAHIQQPTEKELERAEQQRKRRAEEAKKRAEEARKHGYNTGSGAPGSNSRPWTERDIICKLRNSYFKMAEVSEYEQKQGMEPEPSSSEEPAIEDPFLVSNDSNLEWKDITITFLSDWEIHIQFFDKSVTRRYDQAGFEDGRSGNPDSAWERFKKASKDKEISCEYKTKKFDEVRAKEIRSKIRKAFPNIKGDPVPFSKRDNAYKFAFRLKPPVD